MTKKAAPPLKKGQTYKDERKMFRSEETTPNYADGGEVKPRRKKGEHAADATDEDIFSIEVKARRYVNQYVKDHPEYKGQEEAMYRYVLPQMIEKFYDPRSYADSTKEEIEEYDREYGHADGGHVKDIDADSIIDAFLEENPDLEDVSPEEWPEEAIKLLQDVINTGNVDNPNGVLPDEEDEEGEPQADNFDIMALADLVNAGDKEGAWDMLCNMFGTEPASEPKEPKKEEPDKEEPEKEENTLSRLTASDKRVKKPVNRLASFIGKMDW